MAKKGLGGFIRGINDATRAVNSVSRATNTVNRTGKQLKNAVGGDKNKEAGKNANQQQSMEQEASWLCACGASCTTKFCGACGKPEPTAFVCSNCNWERTPENSSMKFCGNCGTKLES